LKISLYLTCYGSQGSTHTEVPIMLPQVADKGYLLHMVYQIIIEIT